MNKAVKFTVYLLFDGNCKQAMEFYHSCFGGKLSVQIVGDSPVKSQVSPEKHKRVLNAHLESEIVDISASDWLAVNKMPMQGNTIYLYLRTRTPDELKTFFDKLSDGAITTDPLKEMFFGTFGTLTDKFGIQWMFVSEKS